MKKYAWSVVWCLLAVLGASCSEQLDGAWQGNGEKTRVKAVLADLKVDGADASLDKEKSVEDMQACLFEGGVMTKVFTGLKASGDGYALELDRMSGTLYMLANTARLVDLNRMLAAGITEEEWLATTVSARDGQVDEFFAGALQLDGQPKGTYTLPLTLKRGFARFDLLVRATQVQVRSVTLKNVMQQGYLLEQAEVASPAGAPMNNLTFQFDEPLQHDSLGLAYAYEQHNPDLAVAVDVLIGGRAYVLEASLPATLKRNSVYTLTVRKDHVTEQVRLEVEAWGDGGESALVPDLDSRLTIDPTDSHLPDGAQVGADGSVLELPYLAADFTLAVDCDEELEFDSSSDVTVVVERVEAGRGKNLFRIRKQLVAPGYPEGEAKVYFRRKGLQHAYEEDHLTLVLQANPIRLEGELAFDKENYTCDFQRYIDNELGRFVMPEGLELVAECPDGDPWLKVEPAADNAQTYRVVGGWKPNDPNADGREQAATLVVRRMSDGQETERYVVKRRNWGLPVTQVNGIWWCKYNAIGNSKRFEEQILCAQDPARLAGMTVRDYLKNCPQEMYVKLWNSAYEGGSGEALKAVYKDDKWTLDGWRSSESVHINGLDATAISPDGYEMPTFDDYKCILGYPMTIPLNWGEYSPATGGSDYRCRIIWEIRSGIQMDGNALGDMAFFSLESVRGYSSEPLTFYGIGSQWGNEGINANNFLIANCNQNNLQGSFINGSRRLTINGAGANNTRIVRFKKSPVEYIYGVEE